MLKYFVMGFLLLAIPSFAENIESFPQPSDYLAEIRVLLRQDWPANRTVNLVFHGHSVPAGYFKTPEVKTLESYPFLVLKELKGLFPNAVINAITTAVGGENSESGAERFEADVLIHKPDVVFIDYALNDRPIGLEAARIAWASMIQKAVERKIKVILLTPSPDLDVDILDSTTELEKHAAQIRALAKEYGVGLVDSYALFRQIAAAGQSLEPYMSQPNHPNGKGHSLIARAIVEYFKENVPPEMK